MREGTRRRTAIVLGAITVAAAGAAMLPGKSVSASTGSSTQGVTATVVAGTIAVVAPAPLVANLNPGVANSNISLGNLVFTNTLNSGSAWSVTATSTDWTLLTNSIKFTEMTFTAGSSFTPVIGATGSPSAGPGGTLSGSDATPGTTQSNPVTLATGTAGTQGTFTQGGNTISVTVPGGTPTGAYVGTITYTITG